MPRVFITDCEGPVSKNDNAYEITSHFIPNGGRVFAVISRYDDFLADILRRPGHKAGSTLKLILPFFIAYDVTDQRMLEFSARNLLLVSGVKYTLQYVRGIGSAFIVSTSYEHYLRPLCQALAFPYENTYCTRLNIDKYSIIEHEKIRLKEIVEKIGRLPMIRIPSRAKTLADLPGKDQETIGCLDRFFREEIASMECGRIYSEVNPVGGSEKADAIEDVARKLQVELADIMYVGDSITDTEAFRLVKENGGLAVSFNGNMYAVRNAEIAVLAEDAVTPALIADVFIRYGKKETLRLAEDWSIGALARSSINPALLRRLSRSYLGRLPKLKIITSENMEALMKESTDFRKEVRGRKIGDLG